MCVTAARSTGLLPGETELPGDAPKAQAPAAVVPDPVIVASLVSMGFAENGCKRAVFCALPLASGTGRGVVWDTGCGNQELRRRAGNGVDPAGM